MAASQQNSAPLVSLKDRHQEMLAELERYRLLVESVQDYAIFLMDPNGYIQTWNRGAAKIKGYTAKEIIGKHFSSFYLPRDKASKKPQRELDLATKFGRIEDEDWRVRKDGSKFWANVIITALHDDTGGLVGFAKVTRDLTERKQHEDELRQANAMLKRQRTELERLNTSKDEFISLASHQLRTPATGIKQYLGMMLEGFMGKLSSEQLACVQKAYESNEHQLVIVNDLLKVAQIDAGKVVLHKSPTDIRELLQNVIDEYGEKFAGRQQRVVLEVPKTLRAMVDASHYRMALENLVDNASKYTPQGGDIKLTGKIADSNLAVCVEDSGVGIAKQDIPRLFEKFTRIPNVLSDSVGGTGLGLYWACQVISLHGGKIDITSKLGKGTTFQLTVPKG